MMEAIFGAAETADHRPYRGYRKLETQARSGPTPAIRMNMETPNKIRRAVELGHQPTAARAEKSDEITDLWEGRRREGDLCDNLLRTSMIYKAIPKFSSSWQRHTTYRRMF